MNKNRDNLMSAILKRAISAQNRWKQDVSSKKMNRRQHFLSSDEEEGDEEGDSKRGSSVQAPSSPFQAS